MHPTADWIAPRRSPRTKKRAPREAPEDAVIPGRWAGCNEERTLSGSEKRLYASEVRKDMAYFGRSYKKADLTVDISRLGPREAAAKVNEVLAHRS
jgi:hypothetical protein